MKDKVVSFFKKYNPMKLFMVFGSTYRLSKMLLNKRKAYFIMTLLILTFIFLFINLYFVISSLFVGKYLSVIMHTVFSLIIYYSIVDIQNFNEEQEKMWKEIKNEKKNS